MQPETGQTVRQAGIAFAAGAFTAASLAAVCGAFLAYRIGFSTIREEAGIELTRLVLDLPDDLVDELEAMDAVVGNAGNPTGAREHDTMLVRPDPILGWALRPDVSVDAYQIRADGRMNIDPPVVYTRTGAPLSEALRSYLAQRTLVRTTHTTDANGFRTTLPRVDSPLRILMVGDSGLFGIGVEDADTIASQLQRLVGPSRRVVNAGVAGYDGDQAFEVAQQLSAKETFESLVYVAHANDFYAPRHISNPEKARAVMERFESLRSRFPGGIVVALITHLEYTLDDVLLADGWNDERIASLDRLRSDLPETARRAGFPFVDWTTIAVEVRERERTPFGPWSLYVDHAHLAPRGTALLAQRIHGAMTGAGR